MTHEQCYDYRAGCEFAAIFSNFGQTRVHLVNERRRRLLPSEDPDLSQFITRGYEKQGVIIHNNCKACGGKGYHVCCL